MPYLPTLAHRLLPWIKPTLIHQSKHWLMHGLILAAFVSGLTPLALHAEPGNDHAAPTGKRLEDDADALEKIRQILHAGIPERATVKVPVKSNHSSEAAEPDSQGKHSDSSPDHATSKPSAQKKPASTAGARTSASHGESTGHSSGKDHLHWSYDGPTGPAHWSELSPDNKLCDQGHFQSPIHITSQETVTLNLEPIQFEYESLAGDILNNGHTIQINVSSQNTIAVRGQQYKLLQFHFHHPSEERINGRTFPMVIHMVHKSDSGQLAVVGIMVEEGPDNPLVNHLWSRLPFLEGQTNPLASNTFELLTLLPKERGYFTFTGSLTTPPCSENVLWMIMQKPITFSPAQIETFTRLYPHNARPLQQVNRRLIQASQ